MLHVDLITRSYGSEINGLARYDRALYEGLRARDRAAVTLRPLTPPSSPALRRIKRLSGLDLAAFLGTYPLELPAGDGALAHLTTSSHALALRGGLSRPVVVTVHDIIHHTYRRDRRLSTYRHAAQRLCDALALRRLRHASAILASSAYTRQRLIAELGLDGERIAVVPLGLDRERFQPRAVPASFFRSYGLDPATPYVLHVSSEEPRKNIETLLRAWARVRQRYPDALLLKVGRCLYPDERARLLRLSADLGLEAAVRFIDAVPDADLQLFYSGARAFAFPSLAEGFGFPVLEALACGTPVVCSTAPALIELVADLARLHEPRDDAGLAERLCAALAAPPAAAWRDRAVAHAHSFSWRRTVAQTEAIYERVLRARPTGDADVAPPMVLGK